MALRNWTSRWWQTSAVLLGVNSVVFGFLFANSDELTWGIGVGFLPAVLIFAGFGIRNSQRMVATVLLTVGSVAAALAWWMGYTVLLALAIVVGGFWSGKIGPKKTEVGRPPSPDHPGV